jgi:hypothetical protein
MTGPMLTPEARASRDERIFAMLKEGKELTKIAKEFHLSSTRVAQIRDGKAGGRTPQNPKPKSTTPAPFKPRPKTKRRKTTTKPIANVHHEETTPFTHTKEDVAVALATGHCREILRQLAGQTGVPERLLAERVGRTLYGR